MASVRMCSCHLSSDVSYIYIYIYTSVWLDQADHAVLCMKNVEL